MNQSPYNIQRITEWIQSEVDYNFYNPGYTIAFNNDQVLLEENDNILNKVSPYCLLVPRYSFFQMRTPHMCFVSKNIENIDLCSTKYYLVQFASKLCYLNKIHTYQVEKNKRSNSISMRMFPRLKFICFHAGCGDLFIGKNNHHKMFECPHRSILCPEQTCQFINNVNTVIIHSINCPFSYVVLRNK